MRWNVVLEMGKNYINCPPIADYSNIICQTSKQGRPAHIGKLGNRLGRSYSGGGMARQTT